MSNATPNLFTPEPQHTSVQAHNASTYPASAAVITQTQSDSPPAPGNEALLSASEIAHLDVHNDTLAVQTPVINSPSQPLIQAPTQLSPTLECLTATCLLHQLDK